LVLPAVHPEVVVLIGFALKEKSRVAPRPAIAVTNGPPVYAESTVEVGSEQTVVVVHSAEVLIPICPESGVSGAVVLPSPTSMSLMTLTSPQDRRIQHDGISFVSSTSVWPLHENFIVIVIPVGSVSRISAGDVRPGPEIPVGGEIHDNIHRHILPALSPHVVAMLSLTVPVEIEVTPSVTARVAHDCPIDTKISRIGGFVPTPV